jgi:hypothetical protein
MLILMHHYSQQIDGPIQLKKNRFETKRELDGRQNGLVCEMRCEAYRLFSIINETISWGSEGYIFRSLRATVSLF